MTSKPAESSLFQRVASTDPDVRMPLEERARGADQTDKRELSHACSGAPGAVKALAARTSSTRAAIWARMESGTKLAES